MRAVVAAAMLASVLARAPSLSVTSGGMQLSLTPCHSSPGAANQTFTLTTVAPFVNPAAISTMGGFCLDIPGASPYHATAGASVSLQPCGHGPMNTRANQYWSIQGNTVRSLQLLDGPICFGTKALVGVLDDCDSPAAQFDIGFQGTDSGPIRQAGQCVTATGLYRNHTTVLYS